MLLLSKFTYIRVDEEGVFTFRCSSSGMARMHHIILPIIVLLLTALPLFGQDPPFNQKADSPLMQSTFGDSLTQTLDNWGIQIGGWTNGSFTASNRTGDILPYGFNYQGNEFQLQQNWLRFDWNNINNKNQAGFGIHSDIILPGTDYRFTLPKGLWNKQLSDNDGMPATYGIDPVQLYAQIDLPQIADGFDLKIGRFYSLIGVERIDAPMNPLASHAYTLIYNPLTQTGGLATIKINEQLRVSTGLVTGTDICFDAASSLYFISSLQLLLDQQSSFTFSTILGKGEYDVEHAQHNPQIFDAIYCLQLNESLTWKIECLYGFTNDERFNGYCDWFGMVNYLSANLSDEATANARIEFFQDPKGQRTGHPGLYTAVAGGLTYSPASWLWLRPELRYDYHRDQPFNERSNLFTAAMDVIIRW